jgi:hypothetical protein
MAQQNRQPNSAGQTEVIRTLARLLGRQAAREQLSAACLASSSNPDSSNQQPVVRSNTPVPQSRSLG